MCAITNLPSSLLSLFLLIAIQNHQLLLTDAQRVCTPGWIYVNDKCWNYERIGLTWDEAEAACRRDGAALASFHADEESRFLYSIIKKFGLPVTKLSNDPNRQADDFIFAQPQANINCFRGFPQSVLIGFAEVALQVQNVEDCKFQCFDSDNLYNFKCKSLMYYPDTQDCILNNANKAEQPALYSEETFGETVDYYDNNCDSTVIVDPPTDPPTNPPINPATRPPTIVDNLDGDCFEEFKDSVLIGYADELLGKLSFQQCQDACTGAEAQYGFRCNSFIYFREGNQRTASETVCILNEVTKDTDQSTKALFQKEAGVDYFQRTACKRVAGQCSSRTIDMMFVVDGSGSIGPRSFEDIRNFLKLMVEPLNIGVNDSNVGIIQFNEAPETEFPLRGYQTKTQVESGIQAMKWLNGRTMIGRALQYALDAELTRSNGDRPTVDNVVVTLTDGLSQDDPSPPSSQMRNLRMETYAIGVTDAVFDEQLLAIAGAPERVYKVRDFSQLDNNLKEALFKQICPGENPSTEPPTLPPIVITTPAPNPARDLEGIWIGYRNQAPAFAPPQSPQSEFEWVDGTRVDYENWFIGEPNLYPGNDCVASEYAPLQRWSALPCNQKRGYVCKKDPTDQLQDAILPVSSAFLRRYLIRKERRRQYMKNRANKRINRR